jgi:citrate synthase
MYSAAMAGDEDWLSSEAAAARLHVKPETLYAYVSRGMIRSERIPGTRRSRFRRGDVERIAARQRGGGRAGALEVVVETSLTLLDPAGALYYRGWNVDDAVAAGVPFETVASWLWSGAVDHAPFVAPDAARAAAAGIGTALRDQPPTDRMRASIVAVRHTDPLRDDRRPSAVAMTGRALIATLVDTMPLQGDDEAAPDAPIARRLWSRLTTRRATAPNVRLLDTALVLLADHDLAASTLAARIAASTWADPYLVVEAGLAVLGGPLHGSASAAARTMLREVVRDGVTPSEAIGRRLRDQELIPGFGHRIYTHRDPRADLLLAALADARRDLASEHAIIATMDERGLPFPNIDFALASLTERYDMIDAAGEVIFAIARIVGWLAHAAEEYPHRLRFRPRAAYVGAAPASGRAGVADGGAPD